MKRSRKRRRESSGGPGGEAGETAAARASRKLRSLKLLTQMQIELVRDTEQALADLQTEQSEAGEQE